ILGLSIMGYPPVADELPGIVIKPELPSEIGETLRIRQDINLKILAGSNIASKFGIVIRPGKLEVKYPFSDGDSLPETGFGVRALYAPDSSKILLGNSTSSRIEIKSASLDFSFVTNRSETNFIIGFEMPDLLLVIDTME